MVAVITGNGLGLGNTSLTQLGQAQGGSPSLGQAANNSYVNTATGNLILQTQDEGVLFDGLPLNVLRTYNSQGQLSSNGWSYGFSRNLNGLTGTLNTAGSTITRTDDDSSSVVYSYNASLGMYVSTAQSGAVDTLSWSATSSAWTWSDAADNTQETYNATGQLTALTDTATGASYSFSYSNGQLSQIVAGDGDTLVFGYNTSNQLISLSIQEMPPGQTAAVTRQAMGYAYDSQGRLVVVSTVLGSDTNSTTAAYTTTYTYLGATDLVDSVTQSDGTTVSYTYAQDAQGAYQVTGIATGTGASAQSVRLSYGAGSTTVTDSAGNVTTYQYNTAGELTSVAAPIVNGISPTTTYTYDTSGNLLTSTDPDGAVTSYAYDDNGNLLNVEDGAGNTVSYTYSADDQVTSKTTYTVAAQGEAGQSGYVAPSGAQTTYYVYNTNNQLAYTIDPLGNVSENDYTLVNGLSELTTSRLYMGTTYSTSGNSPSNPPTLAQMQAWVQGGNVQSALSQNRLTTYTYDVRGQLATQTQYDTLDANGNGVLTNGTVVTVTTYDAYGKLLQTSSETGANHSTLQTTSYAYDGMGRMVSKTDPLGNITSYVYNGNTLIVTQANGLVTTQIINNAGQIVSNMQSTVSAMQASTVDPSVSLSFNLNVNSTTYTNVQLAYGAHDISQANGTSQWVEGIFATIGVYNTQTNTVIYERLYGTPLTEAQYTQLSASPTAATLQSILAASTGDQISLTIYSSSGQQQAQVQYGTYTFTNPDGSGDPVTGSLVTLNSSNNETIKYATPLTVAQLDSIGETPTLSALQSLLTSRANDQLTINAVDNSSTGISASVAFGSYLNNSNVRVTGEFITVNQYSSQGFLAGSTTYLTPLTAAQVASLGSSPTVAQIKALITTSPSDQIYLYARNSSGALVSFVSHVIPNRTGVGLNADGSVDYLAAGEYIFVYNSGVSNAGTVYTTPLTADQIASLGAEPTDSQIQALIPAGSSHFTATRMSIGNSSGPVYMQIDSGVTTTPNGPTFGYFVSVNYFNSTGNYTSTVEYANPLTAAQVSSLGGSPTVAQVLALVQPSIYDVVESTVFDANNRVVAQVVTQTVSVTNPDGSSSNVVQNHINTFQYNSQGQQIARTSYANPLTPLQVESMGSAPTVSQIQDLLTPSNNDQVNLTIYNSNGGVGARVSYETHYFTNPDGTIRTVTGEFATIYGANSAQLYKNPLTAGQIASLGDSPSLTALQEVLAASNGARLITYGYDSEGRQISSTNTQGQTSYTLYDADGDVAYTVSANGDVVGYTYDADGHVIQAKQYATPLTASQLAVLGATPTPATLQGFLASTSSDLVTTTVYNAAGEVVATIDTAGNAATRIYDGAGDVLSTTEYAMPLTAAQLEALGSAPTLAAVMADITPSANDRTTLTIYDADGQTVAVIDPVGNVKVMGYDNAGDMVSSTTFPTALTTAQAQALRSSPSMPTLQLLLNPSSLTIYNTSNKPVATINVSGVVTITHYDASGNASEVTTYATPLTQAQVFALGVGATLQQVEAVVTPSAGDVTTLTVYNSSNQAIATVNAQGQVTENTYDAAGNIIASTVYASTLTVAQIASLGSAPTMEALQALVVSGTNDQTSYTLYDTSDRQVATVGPAGIVTITSYSLAEGVTSATQYATALTTQQLASFADNPTLSNLQSEVIGSIADQTDLSFYNTSEQRVATVSAGGEVVFDSYNSSGELIGSVMVATPLTTVQLASLVSSPSLSALQADVDFNEGSSTSLAIYNSSGQEVATVSSGGVVVVTAYDAYGNVAATIKYANALTAQQVDSLSANPSLAELQSMLVPNASDSVGVNIFDANHNVLAYVLNGYVNTVTYDANGNVTATTSYQNTLTAQQAELLATSPSLVTLQTLVTPSVLDQTTLTVWDANDLPIATVKSVPRLDPSVGHVVCEGQVAIMAYDAAGDIVANTIYANYLTTQQVASLGTATTVAQIQALIMPSANDATTLTIRDANENPVAVIQWVDPVYDSSTNSYSFSGQVTTSTYNAAGKVIASTQYATNLTSSQLAALGDAPTLAEVNADITPSSNDQTTLTIYDANGNQVASILPISGGGVVTVTTYNSVGAVAEKVTYATALTTSQIEQLGNTPTLAEVQALLEPSIYDHISALTIYNANNQVLATLTQVVFGSSPEYSVVMSTYNSGGDNTSTVQYANALTGEQVNTLEGDPTLSALQAMVVPSSNDQVTYYYYDGTSNPFVKLVSNQNVYNPVAGVWGFGYVVTTYAYDASGNQVSVQTHQDVLTQTQVDALNADPTPQTLQSFLPPKYDSYSSSSITIYDANERVVGVVSNNDIYTTTYNANGKVVTSFTYLYGLSFLQQQQLVADPTVANLLSMVTSSPYDGGSLTVYSSSGTVAAMLTLNQQFVYESGQKYLVGPDTATLTIYDEAGNQISSTTYANAPTTAQLIGLGTSPTLAQVQSLIVPSANDSTDLTIRNAAGWVVGTVNPQGDATIYTYDEAGNETSSHLYATSLTGLEIDQLVQAPTLAALQAMVLTSAGDTLTATIYGANEQILGTASTSGGISLMSYDVRGNLVATKHYANNLSVVQIQSLLEAPSIATLQFDLYAAQGDSISQMFYNAAGQPIAAIAPDGVVTITTYDAAGHATAITQYAIPLSPDNGQITSYAQLISSLTPSGNDLTTRTIYNANEQPIVQISATGQVTVTAYNAAGDAIGTTIYTKALSAAQMYNLGNAPTLASLDQLLAPTTRAVYNAAGEQIATIDPEGNVSYSFYDGAGQLTGTVDADGNVVAYTYDADGHLVQTTAYATPISTSGWLNADGTISSAYPGSLLLPPSSASDRTTTKLYDSVGDVIATVDPSGSVSTSTYDAFGEVTSSTQYATPLTAQQIASLGSNPSWAALQAVITTNANDRTSNAQYDSDGREIESTNAAGFTTQTSYDADGNVVLQSRQIGAGSYATTRSYYDGTGRLVAQIDADGYLTIDSYDATTATTTSTRYATALSAAQIAALTGSETTSQLIALLGTSTTNEQGSKTYNADDQVISSTAADGTVTTYQYDGDGQLIGTIETPASGQGVARTTSTTYDTSGNITSTTDADGHTTTYLYNQDGQRIEATDAMGNSTWYYYDADGQLIYALQGQPAGGQPNQLGNVTVYAYDAFGDVTSTTAYASQLSLDVSNPSHGNLINPNESTVAQIAAAIGALPSSAADPNDTVTRTYTNDGQLASVTSGDGYETAYNYDAFGDRIQIQQQISQAGQPLTSANSVTTAYAYNADGEQTGETDAVGTDVQRSTSATYDGLGDVLTTTDGVGNTTTYQYDALGQQISSSLTVQGRARSTETSYDAFGRVLSTTDALGNTTTYSYNLATHTTTVTTPDGVIMTTVKNAYGETISVADGAGNTTSYTYDADGNLLTTTDALGAASTNQYDADGDLIQTTDADGNVVTYSYDATGRVISMTVDPKGLNRVTTYGYDGEGRKISVTDPLGTVTTYAYDADGNVLTQVQDAGNLNNTTTYTYDGDGNALTVTQGSGTSVATTTSYSYDALGREVAKIVDPNGLALTTLYQYDANNNRVAVTDSYGNITYTVYNEADQAIYTIASANGPNSGVYAVTGYTYDVDGRLTSTVKYPSFISGSSGTVTFFRGNLDGNKEQTISNVIANASASAFIASYNVYNADGQLIYQIDPSGAVSEMRYNTLGQVDETLAYAHPIALVQPLTQALQAGTITPSDIQAALADQNNSDSTARVSYSYYDADGRVTFKVSLNQVDGVLSAVVSQVTYDAAGRVASSIQYGVPLPLSDVGGGDTTASIAQAVAQANTAATTRITQYFYDAAGEQVAQVDPNGNVSFIFYDAAGRVSATVDATGAVVKYARDDLGNVIQQTSYATTVNTAGWIQDGKVEATISQAIPASNSGSDRVTTTTYDALNRVATVTTCSQTGWFANGLGVYVSEDGDTLTYTYDNDSRVVETTDVDLSGTSPTRTTLYFYGTSQNTIATLNADGILSVDLYDGAGHLLQQTVYATPANAATDANGNPVQPTPPSSPNDETTSNYYDSLGNLTGTLDADGYYIGYNYDADGRQTGVDRFATALATGTQASFRYTAGSVYPNGYQLQAMLQGGPSQASSKAYDAYGDVVSTTDTYGLLSLYTYDNAGNLTQTWEATDSRDDGTESDSRTTSNAYDAFGDLISSTDGVGHVTTYTNDANGNKTSMTDPLGNTTWYVYDQDNRLAYTVVGIADSSGNLNAYGEVKQTSYDAFGDVVSTIAYSGLMTLGAGFSPTLTSMQSASNSLSGQGVNADDWVTYNYDLEGNVLSKIDGNNNETDYIYDGFNQLSSKTNSDGVNGLTTLYTYDSMGHLTSQVDEYGACSEGGSGEFFFSNVRQDSIVSSGSGDGATILRTQEWTYDAFGNVASYTDGNNNTATYTYDDLNQQLSQSLTVSGQVRETTTSYDAYGRVLTSTDAEGLVTSYSYGEAAETVTEIKPGNISSVTAYNVDGQVISSTDAQGNTTSYFYDGDGHLIQTVNPDGSAATNQYDADGYLVKATDADGHVTAYTYDAAGHMLSKAVDPGGMNLVTTYEYDGRGLMIYETDPSGIATAYYYDGNGNVASIVKNATSRSSASESSDYTYNDLNEVLSATTGGMVNGAWALADSEYGYDALGRMISETSDTGHERKIRYTYDADGNVISKTDIDGNSTSYYYNEADQQIYAISPNGAVTYTTYNANGQVTSTTQYATELTPELMYDVANDGADSIAYFVGTSADDRTTYSIYNNAGQLEFTVDPNGSVTQMLYNSLGQVSETLAYSTPVQLSSADVADLQAGNGTAVSDIQAALSAAGDASNNARVTYAYYDDMGRLSCTLSSATLNGQSGYLATQTQYDADGNVIASIQYGDLIPASQASAASTTADMDTYLAGLPDMHVTRSVYDNAGREVYSIDTAGNVTQTEYDGDGRVTATLEYANAIGTPTAWTQAGVAAAVQAANPSSTQVRETQAVYDAFGNVIKTIDDDGNTTSYTYDERGLKLSSTDGNGNTTNYTYDNYGNLLTEASPAVAVASYSSTGAYLGTTTESIVTSYEYDNDGNLRTQIEAYGTPQARTTQFQYDSVGNLIQTTQPDPGAINPQTGLLTATGTNPSISITYNAFGEAVASKDANGNVAYNVYDHDGNVLYAIDGDGYVTGYTYNAYGQQTGVTRYATSVDTVGQGWTVSQPPTLAQVQAAIVTSSSDRTIATAYDVQGNKLSVTEPSITYTNSDGTTASGSPVTQYTYDAYGNVTSQSVLVQGVPGQSNAVWATTYNYYDALGNKLMSVDPMGYVTTNTYDAFGDVLSTTQWATAIATTGLVAGGVMPADPSTGNAATTGLDRITTYTYDNDGNKSSQSVQRSYTNAQGQAVVGWDTTTYGYDGDKHLTTVTENGNTITTAYDALGRVASITGPQVEALKSNWQSLLEATPSLTLTDPSLYMLVSQVVGYTYDSFGNKLVQTQSSSDPSSPTVSTYYQYDNAGRLVGQVTPLDGSAPSWTSDQAKFTAYDANGNVTSQWYTLTGNDNSSVVVTTTNTYDADDQQTSSMVWRQGIPSPDKSTSTTYDAFGEVIASGDGVNTNVVTTYDNDGNKLTSTDPKTGEVHTYGYNLAGQMVTDTVPVAASAGGGTTQTSYTLDLDGRITAEQAPSTNAVTGESAGILHASYDAWGNVLSSTDANGNTTTYTYNERNDVVTETEASVTVANADGTSTLNATPVKTSEYDIDGNLIASKDENGNVIQNIYNALGQKTESIDGAGNTLYTSYDALGNKVAQQDGNGNITFSNVDALGRTVQSGEFELASGSSTRQAVWQQAYVLDQNGDRIVSYDGIGSAYLQSGDTADAALHANYDGYDSQGRVIWSQDAAQRAASTSNAHGTGNYGSGSWSSTPTNANFADGLTGWTPAPGFTAGSFTTSWDGVTVMPAPGAQSGSGSGQQSGVSPTGGDAPEIQTWPLEFSGTNNPNSGSVDLFNNDRVPVVPGQSITANASFIVMGDHGGGVVLINFYDANGNLLNPLTDGGNIVAYTAGPGTSTLTATAPPGAAYATIGINCNNYNEADGTVYCSGVSWNYVPPAYITSLGLDNGSPVITLPGGSFTDQVTNSNFAEGNVGWDTNGWTIHQASNANSGWEASFGGDGSATLVNQDRVPVVPGQTINGLARFSLYLAPNNAAASGQIAINWYDANGNLIKQDTGNLVNDDHKGAWESSSISATAPAGAAYASLAVIGTANGIGSVSVESVQWNYQYIPQVPTGVVQDTYNYDVDGNLISETTADGDTESWQYNQYNQVTQHTDLSGAQYSYTYDANTGAEIGESDNWSPAAQNQVAPSYVTAPLNTPNSETLTYYADGQIATESFSDGSSYSYQYDANGNLISEEDTTVDGNNNAVHTLTQTTYDSHNRVSTVTETNEATGATMLQESFAYDAAGNRREVKATSNGATQDAWYTYDGDNRVEVADGSLQNGQIVITDSTGSYQNAYDADGNVVKIFTRNALGDLMSQSQSFNAQNDLIESMYAVDVTQGATSNGVQKTTTYDADGRALITQTYYEAGATIQSNGQSVEVGSELESATVDFYDVVGRLAESQTFNTPSNWDGTESATPTGTPAPDATTYGSLQLQSEVVYQGPNGTSGYDADGDVVAYQYRDNAGRVDQYQVNYLKKDSYLQADTTGDSNTANVQPATDQTIYDTRGNEVAVAQQNEDPYGNIANTVHVFAYNGDGEIIEREDGTATSGTTLNLGSNPGQEVQHYTYVNGQQLAHFDNAGTLDVLDQVTAFSSNNDSPDSYVVQTGDTLESIAQAEYGNANLWYVIAQANDLASDTNLAFGQRLQIPAVTTHSNSSTTFKPYDPSSIVGSTTPSLPTIAPPPPPAHNGGCSAAEILVIVVTVVVTIVTYGSTSEALEDEMSAFSAGLVAGAAAGAAGSIAGQLTGMAEGIQSGFNWGAVAEGAIGGAISGGVTAGLANSGISSLTSTGANASANGLSLLGDAVQGAASYVGNDIAAKLTDQPANFSWAGLIASSAASVASGELGPTKSESELGQTSGNYFDDLGARAVGDIVNREVGIALGDQHEPSWAQVGEDIAGYAIGEPIGEAIQAPIVQAIKSYKNQQLVNALNAKVNASLAAYNQQLGDKIWNQASIDADNQLANEGQAALNSASAQMEAKIDAAMGGGTSDSEGGATGATDTSHSDDEAQPLAPSAPVTGTGSQHSGFPVMLQGDPSNPSDVAALQKERNAIVKFLASQNGQIGGIAYPAPPAVSNFQGLIDYGKQLSTDYWNSRPTLLLSTVTVGTTSALQDDQEATNESRESSAEFFNQFHGSFWGDMGANAGTLLTDAGNSAIGGILTLKDILTDRASAEQVAEGVFGLATTRPVDLYDHVVDATSRWMDRPSDQQMRDVGDAGFSFLTSLGVGEAPVKAIALTADAISYGRDILDTVEALGSIGDYGNINEDLSAFDRASEGLREPVSPNAPMPIDEVALAGGPTAADEEVPTNGAVPAGGSAPNGVPLDQETFDAIRAMEPGTRPDPATYLPQSYINDQLSSFNEGGSYLVPKDILDRYGRDILGMPDNTQFMMPKTEMDALLERTGGDAAAIEKELGIPEGQWQGRELARIDVSDPDSLNLRMPSGNEMGANAEWLPGGKLPTGLTEGVTDRIPLGRYLESSLGESVSVSESPSTLVLREAVTSGGQADLVQYAQLKAYYAGLDPEYVPSTTGGDGSSVVLDIFGGKTSQVPGAINVDLVAQDGVRGSALQLPFQDGSVSQIIASSPYIPGGSGMMDYLPEASRVLQDNGQLIINSTASNPFGTLPDAQSLEDLGLTVIQDRGPLLPQFQNNIFRFTDGKPFPSNSSVRTTILQKTGGY